MRLAYLLPRTSGVWGVVGVRRVWGLAGWWGCWGLLGGGGGGCTAFSGLEFFSLGF